MIKQYKLKNGLPVILAPMQGTKTVTLFLMFRTGSKYETRELSGISHFLEHMFFKGTAKRPTTRDIANALDSVGGEYNAMTSKEFTGYYAKVDSQKFEIAADVISDMILNSKLEAEEIERERGVIIEEFNMYKDNPMMHIEDVLENLLYGDTPAGWDTIGTKKNIRSFQRKDFLRYMKSQYGTNNAVLCVAGNTLPKHRKLIEKYFSELGKTNYFSMKKTVERQSAPALKFQYKKTDQITLALGVRTFALGHKDEFVLRLLAVMLGGSMSSRLFTEIRERRGLCYHVRASAEYYTDTGYLSTVAGVRSRDLAEAVSAILVEYEKLRNLQIYDPKLQKEIQQAKDMLRGRLLIQLEASDNVASWYAKQAVVRKKILRPEELIARIEAVSAEDIRRVARKIFVNQSLNLAVIGPDKNIGKYRKLLKISDK